MLRMARSKVKLEKQQAEHRSLGSSSTNSSTSVNSREAERGNSERSVVSVDDSEGQKGTIVYTYIYYRSSLVPRPSFSLSPHPPEGGSGHETTIDRESFDCLFYRTYCNFGATVI